ncbi:MAG: hypothetical protein ACYTFK_05020 [Planctomycetota bacterium]|jgi:hypothetical protein
MRLVRYVLFCLFFAVGAGAVALAVLADEVHNYYEGRSLLEKTLADNENIQFLTIEYEAQIDEIRKDPNIVARLRRVVLGLESSDEDTAFPTASQELLAEAGAAVLEDLQADKSAREIPKWVKRISEPKVRRSLFLAGAGLVLVTFIFFGAPAEKPHENQARQTNPS